MFGNWFVAIVYHADLRLFFLIDFQTNIHQITMTKTDSTCAFQYIWI